MRRLMLNVLAVNKIRVQVSFFVLHLLRLQARKEINRDSLFHPQTSRATGFCGKKRKRKRCVIECNGLRDSRATYIYSVVYLIDSSVL